MEQEAGDARREGRDAGDAAPAARDGAREQRDARAPASFGNVGEHHWSRARRDANPEALEYYRSREHAPGVAEGGSSRNFYCMDCDGVIAHDWQGERCPHCRAALAGMSKRYFNWVEINEPAASDARALLPFLIAGLLLLVLVLVLSVRLLS